MPDLDECGCFRLAVAVLRQAANDLCDPRLPTHERDRARRFLQGGGMLWLFAGLVGVPLHLITRWYPLAPYQARPDPAAIPKPEADRPARATSDLRSSFEPPPGGWFIVPESVAARPDLDRFATFVDTRLAAAGSARRRRATRRTQLREG